MLALLLLAGCPHGGLDALPPEGRASRYEVAVATAVADRAATSIHTLELEPLDDRVWTVRTVRTEGTWEDGPQQIRFDSQDPRVTDPWPLTLQHAVASVPAAVRFSPDGVPAELVAPDAWRDRARRTLQALDLPPQALASGESLLDPAGLLRDLKRTFTGMPEAQWVREETVAGVTARRVESCTPEGRGWRCVGRVEAEGGLLHDTRSETRLVFDGRGLVELESSYAGTLLLVGSDGVVRADRPVAGRRWVVRR